MFIVHAAHPNLQDITYSYPKKSSQLPVPFFSESALIFDESAFAFLRLSPAVCRLSSAM